MEYLARPATPAKNTMIIMLFLLWQLGTSPASAQNNIPYAAGELCLRYYGSIYGFVDVNGVDGHDNSFDMNYNNTEYCQSAWTLPKQWGAVLYICPPYDVDDELNGTMLQISLRYSKTSDLPMNHLLLEDILVTDGSVPAKLQGTATTNIQPAVFIDRSPKKDRWTVNGSASALCHPTPNADTGVTVTCLHFTPEQLGDAYCGVGNDQVEAGGCWTRHDMRWRQNSSLNYEIEFGEIYARAEIWAQDRYSYWRGEPSNLSTVVTISFSGEKFVPSIGSYEFWADNSEVTYEEEVEFAEEQLSVDLDGDAQGFPVFRALSDGISYISRNFTYSAPPDTDGAAGFPRLDVVMALFVAALLPFISLV